MNDNINNRKTCLQQGDISAPQIFISSTFESLLTEMRNLLRSKLEDLNYLPMMSELGNFQYTHSKNPVYDDTIHAVSNSQVYILIIGRSYGNIHPIKSDKSISELEYEEAHKNNLPIFIYISKRVWQGFEAYNLGAIKDGMHTHWVDDLKVFNFIKKVAKEDACRCMFFENAKDLIVDFHQQMANLLGGYLRFELKASKWLWSEWETRSVERGAKEIWIITPNFYWDYQDEEFRKIVFNNVINRNVVYRYLYKKSLNNEDRVSEMKRDYVRTLGIKWEEKVMYIPIAEEEFVWCTEQILFNPFDPREEHGIIVDIMDERNKFDKYNIELGRDKRLALRRQFINLWNRYVTKSEWVIKIPHVQ